MTFTGLLLKESLADMTLLDELTIAGRETWQVDNPADFQPGVWTAITFTGESSAAGPTADRISRALKPRWYANFSCGDEVYVIFTGRVFRYQKGDLQAREAAQAYALSVGVPDHQLDWGED